METAQSSEHPLIILNPYANRGNMHAYRTLLRPYREQADYVETSGCGDARERAARAAEEGRAVIIVGGDGSVHEVANGILSTGRRVPLSIIPAGSGNDYAWHALNLPRDPAAAVERAFHGRLIEADAGRVSQYDIGGFAGDAGEGEEIRHCLRNLAAIDGEKALARCTNIFRFIMVKAS